MIVDLSHVHEIALALVWALGRASAIAVISFMVAWILCRTIPKLPPAVKCWIWRLAFVRVLIALFPAAVVALPILRSEPPSQIQIAADSFINDVSVNSATSAPTRPFIKPTDNGEVKASRLPFIVLSVWLGGVVSGCVLLTIRGSRTKRLRNRCSTVTDTSALQVFHRIVQDLGVRRPPPLHQSDEVDSPLLLGVIRPRIVIPRSMLTADVASLRMMLAHELAHFRRHDTRWAMLPLLTRLLFWFHPLVILAEREMDAWREIACDDAAIATGDASVPNYARMLLNVAAASSQKIPLMAIGIIRSRSTLRRRILAMQVVNTWSSRRRIVVTAIVAVFGSCGIIPWVLTGQSTAAMQSNALPATQPASGATGTHAKPEESRTKVSFIGYLLTDALTIRAMTDGVVTGANLKLGSHVKRGQYMVSFESSSAKAAVTKAEAMLQKDKAQLQRERALADAKEMSLGQIAETESVVATDEAELQLRQRELSALEIFSPFDGIISSVSVHQGEFATKGQPLATVVSVDHPTAACDIPVTLYPQLYVGKPVTFETKIYDQEFKGHIEFISPMVDTASNTLKVQAVINDPDHRLRPGFQGSLSIHVK